MVFLGVASVLVILVKAFESIEIKVHETLACFSDADIAGVVQSFDGSLVSTNSGSDEGVGDVVVLVDELGIVLGVIDVACGLIETLLDRCD